MPACWTSSPTSSAELGVGRCFSSWQRGPLSACHNQGGRLTRITSRLLVTLPSNAARGVFRCCLPNSVDGRVTDALTFLDTSDPQQDLA